MSSQNGPSNNPASEEKPAHIARALAWLKAEQNAAEAPSYTSMLLHESAVILECSGEDDQAAKNYREAFSFDRDFREPLERLIALAERHGDHDDLGPLYQQLETSADNTDERARASLERAFFLVERQNDAAAALGLLREITAESPGNAIAWLLLDIVADRLNDFDAREQALEAQLSLTYHPRHRGLLMMEWSDLREQAGDVDRCLELLDQVVSEASSATYLALLRKERVAQKGARNTEYIRTIEQRMRLVERATVDREAGEALGVFTQHRNQTTLGCLEVLASLVHAQAGELSLAERCLANAQDHLPHDLFLKYLSWIQVERLQDWERFVEIGEDLARKSEGPTAAWLWLRVAIARWQAGDVSGARTFVAQGLRADTRSLTLRAFDVHLAMVANDGRALAAAIEAAAECFDSETEKAEWLLAAAGIWALVVRDASSTRTAIAQAGLHGLDPAVAHQASRLLANWSADWSFYDNSTRIAQQHASTPVERIDLLLELLRVRLLQKDYARALDAVAEIAASKESPVLASLVEATLGNTLRRQLDPNASFGNLTAESRTTGRQFVVIDWDRLASLSPSAPMKRALQLASTVQLLLASRLDEARQKLDSLGEQDPSDVVVAAARVVIAQREGRNQETAAILRRTAECTPDAELRATLAVQGILFGIRAGALEDVSELLDLAGLTHPDATSALSRWLLRTVSDKNPRLAERVFEASRGQGSSIRRALEKFGLSIAHGRWPAQLEDLERDRTSAGGGLDVAVSLTGAITQADQYAPPEAPAPLAAAMLALAYFDRWRKSDGETRAESASVQRLSDARSWAKADASLVAQLEWLLACRSANESSEEADARDEVATHLSPKDADALRVSAHLQRFLISAPALDMLASTSAAARLANLEISGPGCDPRRRATAIEETGELLGVASTPPLRVCLGFNQLACGDTPKARSTFAELVDSHPRFIPAWMGLRLVAETIDDAALLAQACAALGDLLSDEHEAAAEWERAAIVLLDRLSDGARGRLALERAVALDVTRGAAFMRLFRLVRDAQQTDQLLALIAARLPHATTRDELLMLHWERARAMRSLGDREGALQALDGVSAIDPNHVGALALAGEINIALGRFDDAARFLAQLARHNDAPTKQRLMGGLAAADLFDKKLNRPAFARDILLDLHREGHSTEAVRERLSALAIRVNAYPLAVELLEILMEERAASTGRADAARLVLVLCRDNLKEPAQAARAVERLLLEIPDDAETIDLVLTGCFEQSDAERWLGNADQLLRERLMEQPLDAVGLERLAAIARWFDDIRTRQACLSALICVGAGTAEIDVELSLLDQRVGHVPAIAIDEQTLQEVCDPEDVGPVAALFQDFAEVYAEALGPTLSVLGVGKKQRVDPRAGLPLRNEIVAWAGAFGVAEFDLYLTDRVAGDAVAIPAERPSLVVSSSLTVPLDPRGRQAVARELFALRRGTCLLRHRSTTELCALVVASCQVGGHPLTAPPYAMLEEFIRGVSSALPRRLRKTFTSRTEALAAEYQGDSALKRYLQAASSSQDRAAALAAGDVSHVLSHLTGQRGRPAGTNELRDRMARLLSFALSPQYLALKDKLGLSAR
jgi:cellulose synthase operon protein C